MHMAPEFLLWGIYRRSYSMHLNINDSKPDSPDYLERQKLYRIYPKGLTNKCVYDTIFNIELNLVHGGSDKNLTKGGAIKDEKNVGRRTAQSKWRLWCLLQNLWLVNKRLVTQINSKEACTYTQKCISRS